MIGSKFSCHFFNQSQVKPKPIVSSFSLIYTVYCTISQASRVEERRGVIVIVIVIENIEDPSPGFMIRNKYNLSLVKSLKRL